MNANLIGIIILVTGLPFVIRGWQSFKVAFFAEHVALGKGCFAIVTIAFGVWLISQGADVAMHPTRATHGWPRAVESAAVSAGVFLGGLPYYVRDNQACERLKANLKTVYDSEVRARPQPQPGVDGWDAINAVMNEMGEMDLWGSRPCCVSVADALPASQFSDRAAVDAAISRDWLCH